MVDLNVMMREQARASLQAELNKAVTDGDMEAATKVTEKIAALAVQTAPKAPPFGDAEIRAELDKQTWFGTDPKRSAKAVEFGKTMDPKKFPSAEAFATAIVKAVDEEFKPTADPDADNGTNPDAGPNDNADAGTAGKAAAPETRPRRSDGPNDGDAISRGSSRTTGPWTKLADAPAAVQKEIKRQADKFISASATKEQRDGFVSKALESHYAAHQRTKGK